MNRVLTTVGLILILSLAAPAAAATPVAGTADSDEVLEHVNDAWTGDLDGMAKRGFIRILTVHNPLFFTFDGAEPKGMARRHGLEFEEAPGQGARPGPLSDHRVHPRRPRRVAARAHRGPRRHRGGET